MDKITEIIKNTNDDDQEKIDWTKAWSSRYSVLKMYQKEVDVSWYSNEIRRLFNLFKNDYGYSELDAMLVLKDILAHEYLDNKGK